MFASQVRKAVTIGDAMFDIRKLSWKSLEKAREARQIAAAAPMRAFGGELMRALRSDALDEAAKSLAAKRATVEGRQEERYAEYDRAAVLVAGLVSWSDEKPISPQSIDDLDEEIADALHREILDLSLPPIDAEIAEGKAEVGSGASTSS